MKYAIAVLNIKPAEFWDLTLAEFNVAMEAHMWKQEQQTEMDLMKLARLAQWNMLPHVKADKIPDVDALLGKEAEKGDRPATTKTDLKEMESEMKQRMRG